MGINERRGTQWSVAKLIPPAAGNNNLKVIRVFKDLKDFNDKPPTNRSAAITKIWHCIPRHNRQVLPLLRLRRLQHYSSSSGIGTFLPVARTVGIGEFHSRSWSPRCFARRATMSGCCAAMSLLSPISSVRL